MGLAVWAGMIAASTPQPERPEPSWDDRVAEFTLPEPEAASSGLGETFAVWSTHYFIPVVSPADPDEPDSHALIDTRGRPISPGLAREDWCHGVLQGSIHIRSPTGEFQSYAYVNSKGPVQADCDRWLGQLADNIKQASRRARFKRLASPLDCADRSRPLTPFRTVAVDPDFIQLGSVLYIDELRGEKFQFNGREIIHDGYLIADDFGGAVERNQIDMFTTGEEDRPLPSIVKSSPGATVAARLTPPDALAALALRRTLSRRCHSPDERTAPLDR